MISQKTFAETAACDGMTSQDTVSKTNTPSLFPTFNFCPQLACAAFEAKLKILVLLDAHGMKKNQGVRFTDAANTSVVSNNSQIILLSSLYRLLIKRIKNT